eukprot:evm.model.scf_279.2 EVM.evm.TU.scf_279.2   scf_279:6124-10415(-)
MDAGLKLLLSATLLFAFRARPAASQGPSIPPPGPYKAGDKALLPSAECPGQSFASLVEQECGSPPGSSKRRPDASSGSLETCEAGLATRELQSAILDRADTRCVAQILIQTSSVSGIEGGFRIPPEVNFVEMCGKRNKDPDVAAIKGLALSILLAGDTDSSLIPKLVEGIVPSFTPPEGGSVPSPPGKTLPPKGHRSGCITVTSTKNGVTTQETTCPSGTEPPAPEPMPSVDAAVFEASLRNRTLLFAVFTSDPNQDAPCSGPTPSKEGRRLATLPGLGNLFAQGYGRNLQCADCDNADSYLCAYCWEEDFCDQFYWC